MTTTIHVNQDFTTLVATGVLVVLGAFVVVVKVVHPKPKRTVVVAQAF